MVSSPPSNEGGRLAWADGFVPTTSITILRDELAKHGFARFADSIDGFLGSTGAAYSALAYHEAMEEIADFREALNQIDGHVTSGTLADIRRTARTALERHS